MLSFCVVFGVFILDVEILDMYCIKFLFNVDSLECDCIGFVGIFFVFFKVWFEEIGV